MLLRACSFDADTYEGPDARIVGRVFDAMDSTWTDIVFTEGPWSNGAAQFGSFSAYGTFNLPQRTTLYWAGYFKANAASGNPARIEFWSGNEGTGTILCALYVRGSAETTFIDYNTTAHNTGVTLTAGVWYFLELKVVFNATTGSAELRVGGTSEYTQSSLNTCGPYTSGPLSVRHGATSWVWFLDDVAVYDTAAHPDDGGSNSLMDFTGPWRMRTVRPNADTAQDDWTPSSGVDNYAMVDDQDNDEDATYNASTSVGDRDELEHNGALNLSPLIAVQVVAAARKTNAGTGDLTVGIESSAVAGETTHSLGEGSAYLHYRHGQDVDPNTGLAWTAANFNAALLTYENG